MRSKRFEDKYWVVLDEAKKKSQHLKNNNKIHINQKVSSKDRRISQTWNGNQRYVWKLLNFIKASPFLRVITWPD